MQVMHFQSFFLQQKQAINDKSGDFRFFDTKLCLNPIEHHHVPVGHANRSKKCFLKVIFMYLDDSQSPKFIHIYEVKSDSIKIENLGFRILGNWPPRCEKCVYLPM